MAAAIIILIILGLMDLMLFVACFEMEKDEEVRRKMSRYVNADVICLAADELIEETNDPTSLAVFQGVKNLVNRMNNIDIVKCIDCKRCSERGGHANCNGYLICTLLNRVVDEDTYCAWGERK